MAVLQSLRRRDGKKGRATRIEMLREFYSVWDEHLVKICEEGARDVLDEIEEGNDE